MPTCDYVGATWLPGEYALQLPADAPAGEYPTTMGIYYWETGERLPVWDGEGHRLPDDAVPVETITVQAGNCGEG